ncbi:T9SS type A sorting domain-containing protein [Runella sp. SP2]|uniref:T9SS type A sorting domain-containing protein n=1 Tax=Runella sp. SP2 TaxID=2268026 RepID=UPI000F07B97E|nr:T9SS type A sorting domain-containing protein [Runella sp. SP2]AYQ31204.1 T9SS C-terminal target domain-containing protein [Runella sp. SP2]
MNQSLLKFRQRIKLTVALVFYVQFVFSQNLVVWELSGATGSQTSNTPSTLTTGINSGLLNRGAGITAVTNSGSINANGWFSSTAPTTLTDAITNNDYYQFSLTIADGYKAKLTGVGLVLRSSNTGPNKVTLRSSIDNFATDLGSAIVTTDALWETITFANALTNVEGTITFRLYGYGSAANAGSNPGLTGTLRIGAGAIAADNDLIIVGTVAPTVSLAASSTSGSEADKTEITLTATTTSNVAGDQTVEVAVSGTGVTTGDYTLSAAKITILNGTNSGSITFKVVDDFIAENTEIATLTAINPSSGISLGETTSQMITITDNDVSGINLTESGGSTKVKEGAEMDSYTIVLKSEPMANVTINITSGGQTTTNPTNVVFTPANWNVAQTVTVTAVDDALIEGNHTETIIQTTSSEDANYNGVVMPSMTVTIADNDEAFDCPTLIATSSKNVEICSGDNSTDISLTSTRNDLEVKLVYFTSAQTGTAMYSGGTSLGSSLTPTGASSPYLLSFNDLTFPLNTTGEAINYYVYAILDVADAQLTEMTCRPYLSFEVTIKPLVTTSVVISSDDSDNNIIVGTTVNFTAVATNGGDAPSFQWKKNNQNVGTSNSTYTDAQLVDGDVISCVLTSNATCPASTTATSNEISIKVTPAEVECGLPTVFEVTGGGSFCAGGDGVEIGLASSETGVKYQLKKGDDNVNAPIEGTGSAISFGKIAIAGTYTVVATRTIEASLGNCNIGMEGSAAIAFNEPINASISGNSEVCKNSPSPSVTFSATGGTSPYTFVYSLNGEPNQTTTTSTISVPTSTTGVFTYTLVSVTDANGCTGTVSNTTAKISVVGAPRITLSVLQTTVNEGTSQVFCDTDSNPVNLLQFTVSGLCVSGSLVVWRVQVGNGAWSDWSGTSPVSQLSNNQPYRYQAACDINCPATFTSPMEVTINQRASVPQAVSLTADGVNVAAGETKEVCSSASQGLLFHATCAVGEVILYSVDGGEYSATIPMALIDNQFHNYRVRCRKSDGTASCVESESGVMRLKLVAMPAAPTAALSSTVSCQAGANFSGQASCGNLKTVWYNALTEAALPNLPATVPAVTTSYYVRCQTENGCLSGKSNVVTFTVNPVHIAPVVTVSQASVCMGTTVTVSANCPAGSSTFWNTGVTSPSFEVSFNNVTKQSYWAKCIFEGGCQSLESAHQDIRWNAFVLTLINLGQSQSAVKPTNNRDDWKNNFIGRDGGAELEQSTQQNPTLYFVENTNKTAPRYWTINVDACGLGTGGSLTFDLLATPEMGVIRSYNTHENNAPYFMYANREGWTELYGPNHPAYGFYEDNGSGGNIYDAGLPKGLYKLGVRYWDMKGWGSIYPATRKPQGNVLAYQEYWFRIQSKDGVGVGGAREEANGKEQGSDRRTAIIPPLGRYAARGRGLTVLPNPVTNILRLQVQDSKGQLVQTTLTDVSGREILSRLFVPETNKHHEEIATEGLESGVYFLKVAVNNQQTTLKVVKVQ